MAQSSPYNFDIYQPRNPKASNYYKCVENHFEDLEQAWDDMYKSRYGYWRTYVMTVIYKYLDCGDLHIAPAFMLEDLEEAFQYEVLKMLKKEK